MKHLDQNTDRFTSSLKAAIWPFILSRSLILAILILASQIDLPTIPAREGVNYNAVIVLNKDKISEALKRVWLSADASWYVGIAQSGYAAEPATTQSPKNWTFFPLYPLLLRGAAALGIPVLFTGLLISNIAFLIALALLFSLTKALTDSNEVASKAIWLISFFPTSYFLSSPLTESIFLFLIVAGFLCIQRHRLALSGILFCLACSTRPTGLLILPAYYLYLARKAEKRPFDILFAIAIAPLGAALYMWHLHHLTGDALAFAHNQQAWNRDKNFPILINELIKQPSLAMMGWNFIYLNLAAAILGLAAAVMLALKKRYEFALLVFLPIAAALATGSLHSMARFVVVLFPIFIVLGELSDKYPRVEKTLLTVFAALLALMTAMYALHVTPGMA